MTVDAHQPQTPARLKAITLASWHWPLIAGFFACALTLILPEKLIRDGDTEMHIAIGQWILAHRAIPFHDVFSFTVPSRLWVPHEWGSEILLAALYQALGWSGIIAAAELAIFASFAILTQALLKYFVPRRAAIGAMLTFLLAEPHLLARPHLLALPLMTLWMCRLISARDDARDPPLTLLPLMIVWANLHGGFIIGLAFTAFLGTEAVIEADGQARIAVARRWGVFLVAAVLCSLATPNGINVYLMALNLTQGTGAINVVAEWQPANFAQYQPVELWLAAFLLIALSTGLRLKWTRALMLLLLVHLGLAHVRNMELLGFISPLLVAAALAARLDVIEGSNGILPLPELPARRATLSLLATVAIALFGIAAFYGGSGLRPGETNAPVTALRAAKAAGLTGPVLNHYDFGGFLMFSGVPVFIDGRTDLYAGEFMETYRRIESGQSEQTLGDTIERYGIQWTLFGPTAGAVRELDRLPGWRRVYADDFAVVHARVDKTK
jgi:hypothetical protein